MIVVGGSVGWGALRRSVKGTHRWTCIWLAALLTAPAFACAANSSFAQQGQAEQPRIEALPPPHLTMDPELDASFRLLYELKFEKGRARIAVWEQVHPGEPLGPALEAAANLFEEFYEKDVFTSEFFLDDKRLLGGIAGEPDAALDRQFWAAAKRAEEEGRARLADNPRDADSLFALTLVAGMRADDVSLIQRRQFESLHYLKEAEKYGETLLAQAPDTTDAYLALGAANYITGCLPTYKRALLWVGGIHGDKKAGMQQLSRTASDGHYLRPFAKLLLALASLREKNEDVTRVQLAELAGEFPDNPLFARELAKLTPRISGSRPSEQ